MKRRNKLAMFLASFGLVAIFATSSPAITGDMDEDGAVRLADALLVLRYVAGTQSLLPYQRTACDIAGGGFPYPAADGVCDILDAVVILNRAYGLITF